MRKAFFVVVAILLILQTVPVTFAAFSGETAVSIEITPGPLTVSVAQTETFLTGVTVSNTMQTSSATLSGVTIDDKRGTAAGWTLGVNSQNLTFTKDPMKVGATQSPLPTLSNESRYDGTCGEMNPAVAYTITIVTGGAVGAATYSVTGGCEGEENQTAQALSAIRNAIGSRGVFIDFPSGTYTAFDSWIVAVDTYSFTHMTITPQTPVSGSGDVNGLSVGSAGALIGSGATSDSMVILTAAQGQGVGSYAQDVGLQLLVHPNSFAGSYSGVLTVSVS